MSMRALVSHRLAGLAMIAAITILLPPFFPSAYYYRVGALVFIFALAAMGLNLLMGFAGQVSLGHAGFLGIGGYTVAIAPIYFGTPSWLCIPGGAALSGLVAFLVGGRSSGSKDIIWPWPRSDLGCSSRSCSPTRRFGPAVLMA